MGLPAPSSPLEPPALPPELPLGSVSSEERESWTCSKDTANGKRTRTTGPPHTSRPEVHRMRHPANSDLTPVSHVHQFGIRTHRSVVESVARDCRPTRRIPQRARPLMQSGATPFPLRRDLRPHSRGPTPRSAAFAGIQMACLRFTAGSRCKLLQSVARGGRIRHDLRRRSSLGHRP